jgi:hypothetical protein
MNVPGFTEEALSTVHELLFSDPYDKRLGVCGARSKDKVGTKTLTPAQEAAAQARIGKTTNESAAVRSEAGRKAAETRKQCKNQANTQPQTTPTVV